MGCYIIYTTAGATSRKTHLPTGEEIGGSHMSNKINLVVEYDNRFVTDTDAKNTATFFRSCKITPDELMSRLYDYLMYNQHTARHYIDFSTETPADYKVIVWANDLARVEVTRIKHHCRVAFTTFAIARDNRSPSGWSILNTGFEHYEYTKCIHNYWLGSDDTNPEHRDWKFN